MFSAAVKRSLVLLLALLSLPLDARVRTVRSAPAATAGGWIRERAIALDNPAPLLHLTRNARVLALGDMTHGTRELYDAKLQLVPLFVEQAGFRTIAFEGSYAEFAAIDDYVAHGRGDLSELLRSHPYWFWDTEEVFELLQWARARNAAGITPRIRVAGVDATIPHTAAARVVETLRRVDSSLATFAAGQYACVESAMSDLCQSLIATSLSLRDRFLAENILHLASLGEKVVVWGHNEHWGRTDYHLVDPTLIRPAGADLSDALGSGYFAIGSLLFDGTFHSVETLPARRPRIAVQTLSVPAPDDYARLFDQSRLTGIVVPLHGAHPSIAAPHRFRIAGSSVISREETTIDEIVSLPAKFDAIHYVRTSTPTRLRHFPVW